MKRTNSNRFAAFLVGLCVFGAGFVSAASAAELPPSQFAQFPNPSVPGSGANQLNGPMAIATSPTNHHIYVAETGNRRFAEYDAWGTFIKAFGWGVLNGDPEPQVCTVLTGCRDGVPGSGPGQFGEEFIKSQFRGPTSIAIDSKGDIYAMDIANYRVQKFDPEGNFILAFGGKVNQTTGGNVCTKASGDTCVPGQLGVEPGEFSVENVSGVIRDHIGIGADDTVYVGDRNRIQVFEPNGSFKSIVPLPEPGNPGVLDVDPVTGTIYFAYNHTGQGTKAPQLNVHRLEPDGDEIEPAIAVDEALGIAVAPGGDVYIIDKPNGEGKNPSQVTPRITVFNSDGKKLTEFGALPLSMEMFATAIGVVGEDPSEFDVYVSEFAGALDGNIGRISVYGATPDAGVVGPPPPAEPVITEQFATTVEADSATLRVKINPKFWNDTTLQLEYGTANCEVSACVKAPAAPVLLSNKVGNEPTLGPGVAIGGLEPGITYHYRFVARSGGGGPVFGPDRTFTTAAPPAPLPACSTNAAFRIGASAFLPDCRAYEMVSPVDKANADIITLFNSINLPAALNKSAASGERLTYSAARAFGEDAVASPYTSQYLATRDPVLGWRGDSISPPRSSPAFNSFTALEVQFRLFDEDLCNGWFNQDTDFQLSPDAVPGYPSIYRDDLCDGGYEAIQTAKPLARSPIAYSFDLQGTGGGHTVFRANDSLISGVAPAGEAAKVYDSFEGGLSYVCVLPNGNPVSSGCSAGTGGGVVPTDRSGQVNNAVSANGQRIYWTAAENGPAKLYLREEATNTIAVSKSSPAQFWGASRDGSRVIFSEAVSESGSINNKLFEFEPEEDLAEGAHEIAGQVLGVAAGMSDDARKVYFASKEALDGAAVAGEPNLYLYEAGGGFTFIATLSDEDINAVRASTQTVSYLHPGKATPDGNALAFIASTGLTGQDSLDARSGKPDSQVYLYQADSDTLTCVSCNKTGARPVGRNVRRGGTDFWASALLPTAPNQLYYPRVISDDGKRVFFNSFDSLVARDTNGVMDVYQWEADGEGSCEEASGCVSLISSGQSPSDSEFVDASANGNDVFFTTNSSLVQQDVGLIDIYDARVGGGFPPPTLPPAECEGEACQGTYVPPNDPTPNSANFRGAGNVKEEAPSRPRCPKGKRKAGKGSKARCVKPKPRKAKKQGGKSKQRNANANRGRSAS